MTTHDDPHGTPPAYRCQKRKNGSDLGFVEVAGRRRYLGPHNTPEGLEAYQRFVAEWRANHGVVPPTGQAATVMELLHLFLKHAEAYYRGPDGELAKEYENHLPAIKILRTTCGRVRGADFTPRNLKAVRQAMIDLKWSRRHVNRQVVRLRSIFKWGVSEGLVPVAVHQALATLPGLRAGRCDAPESEPVGPVSKAEVRAIMPHVSRIVRDMILVQWHTGMRPGELVIMRPIDIDTAGETWFYRPAHHKTQLHGRQRVVPLGPKARKVVQRYLGRGKLDAFMFSSADSAEQHQAMRHAERVTPMSCGNTPGTNKQEKPRRQPGERFKTSTYARAIAYGCQAAWPHPELSKIKRSKLSEEQKAELRKWNAEHRWSPNQIRHAAATRIRKFAGLEMARVVLGHSTMAVTETYYAEADLGKAAKVMAKIG